MEIDYHLLNQVLVFILLLLLFLGTQVAAMYVMKLNRAYCKEHGIHNPETTMFFTISVFLMSFATISGLLAAIMLILIVV